MSYPERLATLRPDFYENLISFFDTNSLHDAKAELETMGYESTERGSMERLFNMIQQYPAQFLYFELDILDHPNLLENSYIEFDEDGELMDAGVTYFISKEAAQDVADKKDIIFLPRNGGAELFKIPYKRLEDAFKRGKVTIDYSEKRYFKVA